MCLLVKTDNKKQPPIKVATEDIKGYKIVVKKWYSRKTYNTPYYPIKVRTGKLYNISDFDKEEINGNGFERLKTDDGYLWLVGRGFFHTYKSRVDVEVHAALLSEHNYRNKIRGKVQILSATIPKGTEYIEGYVVSEHGNAKYPVYASKSIVYEKLKH